MGLRTPVGRILLALLLGSLLWALPATSAASSDGDGADDTDGRLAFIEERLQARRRWALTWQHGWLGFYGLGVVFQGVRASQSTEPAERADLVVSMVKAMIGTTARAARPLKASRGDAELRGLPETTPAERAHRLAVAERLLLRNARESDNRYSWLAHGANVALNVIGALIVHYGFHDPSRAWTSAGIGVGVGELQIWSQPWGARADLAEYQRRFAPAGAPVKRASARRRLIDIDSVSLVASSGPGQLTLGLRLGL